MIYSIEDSKTPGMGYDIYLNGSIHPSKSFDFHKDAVEYAYSDQAAVDAPTWTPLTIMVTVVLVALCSTFILISALYPAR